jgi:hypothetical protein
MIRSAGNPEIYTSCFPRAFFWDRTGRRSKFLFLPELFLGRKRQLKSLRNGSSFLRNSNRSDRCPFGLEPLEEY